MKIDDLAISKTIINSYMRKLLGSLQLDVGLVGAGPSNLVAGYYLATYGLRAAIFESTLAPGGGIWGGGMVLTGKNCRADLPGGQRRIAIDIIVSVEALLCAFRRTWLGHNPV
jgi:ribulose 1,5-bisphosphate synthetase/thiazole synthase